MFVSFWTKATSTYSTFPFESFQCRKSLLFPPFFFFWSLLWGYRDVVSLRQSEPSTAPVTESRGEGSNPIIFLHAHCFLHIGLCVVQCLGSSSPFLSEKVRLAEGRTHFKIFLYVCLCGYVHMSAGAQLGHKRAPDLLHDTWIYK